MKIAVYIVCFNEEMILPYTLRHYKAITDDITVYDAGSTDRSLAICAEYGAKVIPWDTGGQLNSDLDRKLKSACWSGRPADWVIVVDTDELVLFPDGEKTLAAHDVLGTPVIKTTGWDMFSDVFPTTTGQIYEEVKMGAPDNHWYGKPAVLCPARITDIEFGAGAHAVDRIVLPSGRNFAMTEQFPPSQPPVLMLHFKHLGPLERIAEDNRGKRARLAPINVAKRWGNFEDPMKHAIDKRNRIIRDLQRVMP